MGERQAGEKSIAPELLAADGWDFFADRRALLRGGVTTVYVSAGAAGDPRARLVAGRGCVVKLAGAAKDPLSRLLRREAGLEVTLGDLVKRAREDKLTPSDVRGGTFTISNHGVSGSLVATPIIINQPQSAILGVGKLEKRAVVETQNGEDRLIIRPCCYITLTLDHRVMDGHRANRFLDVLVKRLENWA